MPWDVLIDGIWRRWVGGIFFSSYIYNYIQLV
jgi:hypothetical protein